MSYFIRKSEKTEVFFFRVPVVPLSFKSLSVTVQAAIILSLGFLSRRDGLRIVID